MASWAVAALSLAFAFASSVMRIGAGVPARTIPIIESLAAVPFSGPCGSGRHNSGRLGTGFVIFRLFLFVEKFSHHPFNAVVRLGGELMGDTQFVGDLLEFQGKGPGCIYQSSTGLVAVTDLGRRIERFKPRDLYRWCYNKIYKNK